MNNNSIKTWDEEERPREKLMQQGAAALTNAELLAILLHAGTREKSAVDLAREVLSRCSGRLDELSRRQAGAMMDVAGIGE